MSKMAFGDRISGEIKWARSNCHMHLKNLYFKCSGTQSVYNSFLAVIWCYPHSGSLSVLSGACLWSFNLSLKAFRKERTKADVGHSKLHHPFSSPISFHHFDVSMLCFWFSLIVSDWLKLPSIFKISVCLFFILLQFHYGCTYLPEPGTPHIPPSSW